MLNHFFDEKKIPIAINPREIKNSIDSHQPSLSVITKPFNPMIEVMIPLNPNPIAVSKRISFDAILISSNLYSKSIHSMDKGHIFVKDYFFQLY